MIRLTTACLVLLAAAAPRPVPTGYERVAVDARGTLYVGDLGVRQVWRVVPGGRPVPLPKALGRPSGLAVDAAGTLHVADQLDNAVRALGPGGRVRVVLKGLQAPRALAFDAQGRLWIAEAGRIRRREPGGALVTAFDGVEGATALACAPDGAVWFLDHDRLRRLAPDGAVATVAGAPGQPARGHADGRGPDAFFAGPTGLAVDRQGVCWVADTLNGSLRRVTADGRVTTVAGDRRGLEIGVRDGVGLAARFFEPTGLAIGPTGDLFVAEALKAAVRRVTPAGTVTTAIGKPGAVARGERIADGELGLATFGRPSGLAPDGTGGLWVTDADWHLIRHVSTSDMLTTVVGDLATLDEGHRDGPRAVARVQDPRGGVVGPDGSFYFLDGDRARRLAPGGAVSTVATGFNGPSALAFDGRGGLLVADTFNHGIRRVDLTAPGRPVTTVVGKLREPRGVAVATDGTVVVADTGNRRLLRLAADGTPTTWVEGFTAPQALAAGPDGSIFVAEPRPARVWRVTADGTKEELPSPGLREPAALAWPGGDALWIADAGSRALRTAVLIP